ncbi:MAG: transketolase, partial [Alphaproteobacteria bacterium]|nr:transketolase [Alphaproteobacteria bacterium]
VSGAVSMRELSGIYLEHLVKNGVRFIGGSADLSSNTNVRVDGMRDILPNDFSGNFINFGVREHAMAAIMNGLAYAGVRAVCSTFLVFSDYMRGAMRLSALSGLPVVYVLTHDSIAVGQDGPTHQPIEQIAGLRLIPNMNVFRPCNMAEVAWSWTRALGETNRPSCIILSRQKVPQIQSVVFGGIERGGYIVYKPRFKRIRITLVATGAEVPLAVSVAQRLKFGTQVVSMPSVADFLAQDKKYKHKILRGRVVVLEAAAGAPWFELADAVIGINEFGTSGPGDQVYKEYGFDADEIANSICDKIKHGRL